MTGAARAEDQPGRDRPGAVDRVSRLLQEVACSGPGGARLKDLALGTGIARPSVHRLLRELMAVNLVRQASPRRYTLGSGVFMLGLCAPSPIQDMAAMKTLAQDLADRSGEVVYVALRRHDGVHYLLRHEGRDAIRSHLIPAGDVKPFTAGYAGLALLASMSEDQQRERIHHLAVDAPPEWVAPRRWQLQRTMRDKVIEVASQGYCTGHGVMMPGVGGIAAPVPSRHLAPYMAVSISAAEHRLTSERVAALVPQLMNTVRAMSLTID